MESPGISVVLGVPVTHAPCAGCGARITEEELLWLMRTYNGIRSMCAFCGKPIRIVSVPGLRHHHEVSDNRETCWDFDGWKDEEHFSWTTHRREWSLDMDAHLSCARGVCPFGDWDGDQKSVLGTAGRSVDNLGIESPCPKCNALITKEDQDKALRWLFKIQDRPCSICGRGFAILTATIAHRHLFKDQQCKQWSVPDWRAEECVDFCAHFNAGSILRSVSMRAHAFCARHAMPHATWTPPLPRAPWKKQDWSCRIEPWYRGMINGEAAPDWGRMRSPEETRRLWAER